MLPSLLRIAAGVLVVLALSVGYLSLIMWAAGPDNACTGPCSVVAGR